MKKVVFTYILFILILVFCVALNVTAQTTDTPPPDDSTAIKELLNALFNLLLAFHVIVPVWVKVVVPPAVLWLVRRFDKKRLNAQTVKQLKAVIGTPAGPNNMPMHPEHTNKLFDLI